MILTQTNMKNISVAVMAINYYMLMMTVCYYHVTYSGVLNTRGVVLIIAWGGGRLKLLTRRGVGMYN